MVTRSLLCIAILALAGCQICKAPTFIRPPTTGEVWDTTYLIDADPTSVTVTDIHARAAVLGTHYWDYSQVDGVLLPAWRTDAALPNPDRWIGGGDSGIYTGQALATFSFEYGADKSPEALDHIVQTLRGLYILTHASGTPGVIQRNAFPATQPDKFGFPDEWAGRIAKGFVHTGPAIPDPLFGGMIPPHTYYTRGTKDQLTGMVLGLAAAWVVMDPASVDPAHSVLAAKVRATAKQIAEALLGHLNTHDWRIRDEFGKNDTSADYVDDLLRANLLGLVVKMGNPLLQDEYDETFDKFIDLTNTLAYADRFANYSQYYAHNLRYSRALTTWLLEGAGSDKGQKMADYVGTNVWKFTKGHKSAWFAFIRAGMTPDGAAVAEGLLSLKSLSLKPIRMWSSPYHGQEQKPDIASVTLGCEKLYIVEPHLRKPEDYSTWQKEPWDVGHPGWDQEGLGDSSGLDFLLPYHLGRYLGLF